VPGASFQRVGDPRSRVTSANARVLAGGPGNEYIPSIAAVPFFIPPAARFTTLPHSDL